MESPKARKRIKEKVWKEIDEILGLLLECQKRTVRAIGVSDPSKSRSLAINL